MGTSRSVSPTPPPATCPAWCAGDHDGEARHLAELLDVTVTADGTAAHTPRLYLDLRQGPDDARPLIHMEVDEQPVARLLPGEAVELARALLELARLAGEL
ncbi:DUF6907 domain-containing protein [Nonomuraea jabiensis]|uniref:Uncharacterized protein n=1 Tax=Nonomuraea jabiensis TaxID=882448 RepID=A0A7W9G317_9ACTN|nr:hypothetical protein [Nonomuraea jabiensis]MBB5776238.1 hypothetical protein [Nonomuraea jabiensis]